MSIQPNPLASIPLPPDAGLQMALADGADAVDRFELGPVGWRGGLLSLAVVHDLHLAPTQRLGGLERFQHHPRIAAVKAELEEAYLNRLRMLDQATEWSSGVRSAEAVEAMRAIAARDRVPPLYDWIAEEASPAALARFLSLEGGPDGGFDDLVAICQVGLTGPAKVEMATNYWDEMGQGEAAAVHTQLHDNMVQTLDLDRIPREEQPTAALERAALGSVLATNRWLQPQMVGALGLIELQAGPRCRKVAQGLRRVGAPAEALVFYDEHAEADPRHGKDWLDKVVAPLAAESRWADGVVEGARWRSVVNHRFLSVLATHLRP